MSDRTYKFPRTRSRGYRRPRAEAASSAPMEESVCHPSHSHDVSDGVSAVSPAISLSVSPASSREKPTIETQGSKHSDKSGSQSEKRPNCYQCKYRGAIPGNAHSKCKHPAIKEITDHPLMQIAGLMGSRAGPLGSHVTGEIIGVTGDSHGIKNGWFNWPINFDPVWLLTCDGFEQKE